MEKERIGNKKATRSKDKEKEKTQTIKPNKNKTGHGNKRKKQKNEKKTNKQNNSCLAGKNSKYAVIATKMTIDKRTIKHPHGFATITPQIIFFNTVWDSLSSSSSLSILSPGSATTAPTGC